MSIHFGSAQVQSVVSRLRERFKQKYERERDRASIKRRDLKEKKSKKSQKRNTKEPQLAGEYYEKKQQEPTGASSRRAEGVP